MLTIWALISPVICFLPFAITACTMASVDSKAGRIDWQKVWRELREMVSIPETVSIGFIVGMTFIVLLIMILSYVAPLFPILIGFCVLVMFMVVIMAVYLPNIFNKEISLKKNNHRSN